MFDPVGVTGLIVTTVAEGFKVIGFIGHWIEDSKAFGADTRNIKTRLIATSARLETLTSFLHEETGTGSRIDRMSEMQRVAVLGMVRELDILFASYDRAVKKHKLDELASDLSLDSAIQNLALSADGVKSAADKEARATQQEAGRKKAMLWGLFQKKEEWDFCSGCFVCGMFSASRDSVRPCIFLRYLASRLTKALIDTNLIWSNAPGVQIGVTLKQLLTSDTTDGEDLFKPNWVLRSIRHGGCDERVKLLIVDGRSSTVFVEHKPTNLPRRASEEQRRTRKRVSALAKQLSLPDASKSGFYALRCIGVIQQDRPAGFAFVFELPQKMTTQLLEADDGAQPVRQEPTDQAQEPVCRWPTSLSAAIASGQCIRPTLNERFRLAANLIRTCRQFHCVGWLHKSIRSQNILLFSESGVDDRVGSGAPVSLDYSRPYLAGFEFSRSEKHHSEVESDDDIGRNLYRSPGRWGLPEARFSVLDDLYALGVTLLEIGIWRPLIKFEDNFGGMSPTQVSRCLIQHAEQRLPHYMGVGYTSAVLKCLRMDLETPDGRASSTDSNQGTVAPLSDEIRLNMLINDEIISRLEAGARPD